MRLSKIKLTGFKSFIDLTTISFPSNQVGIVGPNGCGKSNIIDAVRWVMGEISAKHLRGAAMTDVIFNGSHTRLPANQASIELVFEGVQLPHQPTEIAVKRQISRDGQSTYFINGLRGRRKDIMELFLGTGLGPRSYAIIEQGVISRLIEAKPEELRLFLEEAAGISKYKERRKETEQHIKHVHDNLARLNEIRNELERQLEKLQKQAKQAEKYQELQQEAQLLKAQLLALRWNTFDIAVQELQHFIDEQDVVLQTNLIKLQNFAETYQQQREAQSIAQTTLQEVQERGYEVQSKLDRVAQEIARIQERREQLQEDLEQLASDGEQTTHSLQTEQQHLDHLARELQETEIELEVQQDTEATMEESVVQAESQLQAWQLQWDDFNQRATEPTQRAQVERTQMQHLEQRLEQVQQRLRRLEEEGQSLPIQAVAQLIADLEAKVLSFKGVVEEVQTRLTGHFEKIRWLREEIQQKSAQLHKKQVQIQQFNGRLAALEALQEGNSALLTWLPLPEISYLAQSIQIEKGWERAVEMVLDDALQAWCVEDLNSLQEALQKPPPQAFMALEISYQSKAETTYSALNLTSLLEKVQAPWSLTSLLKGVWVANTLEEAYRLHHQLAPQESIITPEGIWLGPNWVRSRPAGRLSRAQEIQHLQEQLQNLDEVSQLLSDGLAQQRLSLQELENQRDLAQVQLNDLQQQVSHLQAQQSAKQAHLEQIQTRFEYIQQEQAELTTQFNQDQQALKATRERLHAALDTMSALADEREHLLQQRNFNQEAVLQARTSWQLAKESRHQLEIKLQGLRSQKLNLQQQITRWQTQLEQLTKQRQTLQQTLAQQAGPLQKLQDQQRGYQHQRSQVEESLIQAKQTVAHLEAALNDYEGQRKTLEIHCQQLRHSLEQARLEAQTHQVRRQTLEEQLAASHFSPITLLAQLPDEADETSWQTKLAEIEPKLERFGAINLAALAEFAEQSERQQYLDNQAQDLNQALTALQKAISEIDRETTLRFKRTLASINNFLQEMFPRLFGGGQAKLELTGNDLLNDGVVVLARPPGKRNTHIHLLSGGEKALTAIALVFAIFELNPAPFCMLDEVDAPLDDVNVERFCTLVKTMSERVQFIFISHNKITMEIADQLIGVTMQEPGVSRLVSVDLNKAIEMVRV